MEFSKARQYTLFPVFLVPQTSVTLMLALEMRAKLGMNEKEQGNFSPRRIEGEHGTVCVILLFFGRNGVVFGQQTNSGELELCILFLGHSVIVVPREKTFVVFLVFLALGCEALHIHAFLLRKDGDYNYGKGKPVEQLGLSFSSNL